MRTSNSSLSVLWFRPPLAPERPEFLDSHHHPSFFTLRVLLVFFFFSQFLLELALHMFCPYFLLVTLLFGSLTYVHICKLWWGGDIPFHYSPLLAYRLRQENVPTSSLFIIIFLLMYRKLKKKGKKIQNTKKNKTYLFIFLNLYQSSKIIICNTKQE